MWKQYPDVHWSRRPVWSSSSTKPYCYCVDRLFITNPNNKTLRHWQDIHPSETAAALPAQESSLGLACRCEVIIHHSEHQLFPLVILVKNLSQWPFTGLWLRETDSRLKGYCLYMKPINKFCWGGLIYVCESLCAWCECLCVLEWVWGMVRLCMRHENRDQSSLTATFNNRCHYCHGIILM